MQILIPCRNCGHPKPMFTKQCVNPNCRIALPSIHINDRFDGVVEKLTIITPCVMLATTLRVAFGSKPLTEQELHFLQWTFVSVVFLLASCWFWRK